MRGRRWLIRCAGAVTRNGSAGECACWLRRHGRVEPEEVLFGSDSDHARPKRVAKEGKRALLPSSRGLHVIAYPACSTSPRTGLLRVRVAARRSASQRGATGTAWPSCISVRWRRWGARAGESGARGAGQPQLRVHGCTADHLRVGAVGGAGSRARLSVEHAVPGRPRGRRRVRAARVGGRSAPGGRAHLRRPVGGAARVTELGTPPELRAGSSKRWRKGRSCRHRADRRERRRPPAHRRGRQVPTDSGAARGPSEHPCLSTIHASEMRITRAIMSAGIGRGRLSMPRQ